RSLEERFHITITVNSDPQIGGQVAFAIDRGEQVMTLEQARTLVAQADAGVTTLTEAETEIGPEETELNDVEEIDDQEEMMAAEGSPQRQFDNQREGDRDGGPRRRRRRRRGRGGREGGPYQQPQHGTPPERHEHQDHQAGGQDDAIEEIGGEDGMQPEFA